MLWLRGGQFCSLRSGPHALACRKFGWKGQKTAPSFSELLQTLTRRQGKQSPVLQGTGGRLGWAEIGVYGCGL